MKKQIFQINSTAFDRSLSLCDELFVTMEQIQSRLDNRRENMMRNADRLVSNRRRTPRVSTRKPEIVKVF